MKIIKSMLATCIFMLLLLLIYYLHVRYFKVNVVFYAAIADSIAAAAITGILVFLLRYFTNLTQFEKMLLIVIWLLGGYAFAISVPTVIDRSLSFYILEKLQQRGGAITRNSFEWVFINEYMIEHRLVDIRLTEQLESGTIVIDDGCVRLTNKGNKLATFSRFFRANLLPKERLIMGKYSDYLTNPFKNSIKDIRYLCDDK